MNNEAQNDKSKTEQLSPDENLELEIEQTNDPEILRLRALQSDRQEIQKSLKYLKHVIDKISTRAKQINSLSKSKLDWKKFTKNEKIEKQLEQNRKAGYLEK